MGVLVGILVIVIGMLVIVIMIGMLVLCDLGTNFVHVDFLCLGDQLLEHVPGNRTWLGVQDYLVPKDHQRGNRTDSELARQLRLVLGVHLGEHDVRMLLG